MEVRKQLVKHRGVGAGGLEGAYVPPSDHSGLCRGPGDDAEGYVVTACFFAVAIGAAIATWIF